MTTASAAIPLLKPPGARHPRWLRFALPLLVLSLLIGLIGVVGYRYLSEEIRRETHRTLTVIAEQKRQQIENALAETRIDAELYFSGYSQLQLFFSQWLASGRQDEAVLQQMRVLIEEVVRVRGWGGLALVDAAGRPAVVVGEVDTQAHAALIDDVLQRPRIELVDLHLNARGEAHYGILAPIGAAGAAPLGVAYLTWRADQTLYPLVESWPVPTRSAETYLVRRDGERVRFLTPLRHQHNAALTLTQPLTAPDLPAARAVQGEHGILAGGLDYRGVPVLAYATAVAGTPWLMLAEIDELEAYAGIRTMAWATALMIGLGLVFVYSAGYLLWRRERQRQELAALLAQRAAEARIYDAAEAANAAKSEFLAHMSHEIRTPMNAVLGLAQVLEREPLSGNQRDMVARIRSAGQSLLAILNDVLDLSKIEAGQLRLEPRPFALDVLLANLDSLMGQAARAKGLALRVEVRAEALGPLLGDGLRLEQVLFNLSGNAIKFTERGEVAVLVDARESSEESVRLRFEVRDTGIGISPEALARLFMPFAQADAGIGRRFGGTGLGLSICKRLVELMGGEIGAHSEPGQGSTFWFELPFARATQSEAFALEPTPKPPQSGPRLIGAHLLVVDDSAMNRDLVERALQLEGATATLAADGQQAVQLLKTRPHGFDAVLMDVQMPVMDGLSAIRLIRGELGMTGLPIIAFTAGVRDDQQAAARAAGANDVLAKPMDLEQMAVLLSAWVEPRDADGACAADAEPSPPPAENAEDKSPNADRADAFPLIAGIDRDRAAQRLGRDRAMFLGLLELFVADNADAAELTRHDLAHDDRATAARRMHTLGSNAGFICALELMEAARALEAAIDQGSTELDAQLTELGRQIAELVEASAPWR